MLKALAEMAALSPHKKEGSASLWIQNPLPMHKTEIKILYMFSVGGAFYAWIEL